ncbi:selenocysteine lyase/cysteine desulfurase [Natranaerovirga pectinivora]|uniref:Selenocysteine lyase/cysteine desulfurase n=1 Tax=Natranaerovirga pectinivora TaxID=682400 RepID=A0A4V2V0I7_9FIRM|nr:aminotransferase class V-fold PLP-dependent enzyme [Natranaerovirga pectinivora]TCT16287.1 selenocysteine lyase/cysteine desulfurase [Natranaerovirga pectinivora]
MKSFDNFRDIIIGIDTKVPIENGGYTQSINFDNAATTPPIKPVLDAINNFSPWYSSIHRGTGFKSKLSSSVYDSARETIAAFVGANLLDDTVIFVKNATEAINKLSFRLFETIGTGVVLSSSMEHHSNDLPWRNKYLTDFIETDENGALDIDDLECKLLRYNGRVKLVTVTGASNVTGYINPIYDIAKIVHKYGAKLAVDGAQLVPHMPINIRKDNPLEHIDFLVFSAHKMYAPFGTGVLIGPKSFFKIGVPEIVGGGTVKVVTKNTVVWDDPPNKEEAGSPNIMGVIALEAAIKTLQRMSLSKILQHEKSLTNYTLIRLKEIPEVTLYGNQDSSFHRVGIIPFNINNVHHNIVAEALSNEAGIAVRSGCFCAQPYVQKLLAIPPEQLMYSIRYPNSPHPGLVRISFGFYNTITEVDTLINALQEIVSNKETYIKKYTKKIPN